MLLNEHISYRRDRGRYKAIFCNCLTISGPEINGYFHTQQRSHHPNPVRTNGAWYYAPTCGPIFYIPTKVTTNPHSTRTW